MYETTQVPYGDGTIKVIMITESTNEVTAPTIRFGRYYETAVSCFTDKELEEISAGDDAEVRFYYVMSDEMESDMIMEQFDDAISLAQEDVGSLHKGVYFDVSAAKTVGDDGPVTLNGFYDEVEVQVDIPLYLSAEGRDYYLMVNNMGVCELEKDIDHDAVTLSVETKSIGKSLMLYQDQGEGFAKNEGRFQIKSQYLFIGGIILLAAIWFLMEKRRSQDRDKDDSAT